MTAQKTKTSTKRKTPAPVPLLAPGQPVKWWFSFKFNAAGEPEGSMPAGKKGIFDTKTWTRPTYESDPKKHSQQYLIASSKNPKLKRGSGYLGTSVDDPLGATFAQVYFGSYYLVIWNDQFYDDPIKTKMDSWGHSKGMLASTDDGEGFVMQVSTPSWPASGNKKYPRQTDGNTLGFIRDDDVEVSQHFFATQLTKADLLLVLRALKNATIVTRVSSSSAWKKRPKWKSKGKPWNPPLPKPLPKAPDLRQVINNGGPNDIQEQVKQLLSKSTFKDADIQDCLCQKLSNGVQLISKNSSYQVPPWQLVSATLGGVDLRVASWWASPAIFSTNRKNGTPGCWHEDLGKPGAVKIALSGTWPGVTEPLGLKGHVSPTGNHAKIGVSTKKGINLSIFGDMNQMGAWCKNGYEKGQTCDAHQNGRGGLFYVVENKALCESITALLKGNTAKIDSPQVRRKKQKAVKKKKAKK